MHSYLAEFPTILDIVFINTTSTYIGVEFGGWAAAEVFYFQAEMAHKEAPLHSNCYKI